MCRHSFAMMGKAANRVMRISNVNTLVGTGGTEIER